jgi:hypothetical protein
MKIFLHFIEDEKDYVGLVKTHKVKRITIPQFRNFVRRQFEDENYIYELLSICLIKIKNEYRNQYSEKDKELNFLIIEPIISNCFEVIYNELDREI